MNIPRTVSDLAWLFIA